MASLIQGQIEGQHVHPGFAEKAPLAAFRTCRYQGCHPVRRKLAQAGNAAGLVGRRPRNGRLVAVGLDTVPAGTSQDEGQSQALAYEGDEDDREGQEQDQVSFGKARRQCECRGQRDGVDEVAVRVAARCKTREKAMKVGREIDGMAVSGVAMTGKRVPHQDRTREIIGVWSTLVPREQVTPVITWYES